MSNGFEKSNNEGNINFIIAEIDIKEEDINKEIRIINSFDEMKRIYGWEDEYVDNKDENEKEIKKNIKIKIDDLYLPSFAYHHKFDKAGKHIIQYSFKNNLTNISYLFNGCKSITKIDFTNFNTQNLNKVAGLLSFCDSLKKKNVITSNNQILEELIHVKK